MLKSEQELSIETLPDLRADALHAWDQKILDREKGEALLRLRLRSENPEITETHLKDLLHASPERYNMKLQENLARAQFERIHEKLMTLKKELSVRAF